ncbi:MAG: hypothetical protein AB1765_02415 [Candidatus Hydrogenedentota bacterium]
MFARLVKSKNKSYVVIVESYRDKRRLEIELKKHSIEYSPEKIREALNELQFSIVEIKNEIFFIRSKIEGLANDILRILKIKIPPTITISADFY